MSGKDLFEQQWQNLHEAMRTESISRRSFMKVAGAAAAAMGLSSTTGAFAAPAPGTRIITSASQAANNVLVFGSGQDISNLDPHTGHDYSIAWGRKPSTIAVPLLRKPGHHRAAARHRDVGNTDASEFTIKLTDQAKFQTAQP